MLDWYIVLLQCYMILSSCQYSYPIENLMVFLQDVLFGDGQVVPLPIYEYCSVNQLYLWAFQIPSLLLFFLCLGTFDNMAFKCVHVLGDCLSFGGIIFRKHM